MGKDGYGDEQAVSAIHPDVTEPGPAGPEGVDDNPMVWKDYRLKLRVKGRTYIEGDAVINTKDAKVPGMVFDLPEWNGLIYVSLDEFEATFEPAV